MMALSSASILNRVVQQGIIRPQKQHTSSESLTKQITSLLGANRFQKAIALLLVSPIPVSDSLYAHLFQLCSASSAIVEARKVESHLISFSPSPPVFLLNRAIETFANCGCLDDARELFDKMSKRDGGSWNSMISAYARGKRPDQALCLFSRMNGDGISANEITFASVLGCCGSVLELCLAKEVHGLMLKRGFCQNIILETSLVDVYGKCLNMCDARRKFSEIRNPNCVTWNVIVRRYLEIANEKEAVFMFFEMLGKNISPLNFTFSNAVIACSRIRALKEGMEIHGVAVKINFERDKNVCSALIDMYIKCGKIESAKRIFDLPGSKDLVTWTSIVSGYALSGRTEIARDLFDEMPERNVISWNAMLAGYVGNFQWNEAFEFISLMRSNSNGIDCATAGLILKVCSGLSDVETGKQVHGFIYRNGFHYNIFVGNALINMYGKCGNLRNARICFYQMSECRDKVSWNALLSSYARHHRSEQAMSFFEEMQKEGAKPSKFTFGTLLAACANIFALKQGKEIHGFMTRNGYDIDIVLRGAFVDMYSKCRCIDYSLRIFMEGASRDLILYNSMILGCCHNRKGVYALELVVCMEQEGLKPDHVTFQGILLACIYEGQVELGRQYFNLMSSEYFVIPRLEHYEYMIELYSRYGCMHELEDFVKNMPFDPTCQMLLKVVDACKKHGFSKLEEWAARRLSELNPQVSVSTEVNKTVSEPSIARISNFTVSKSEIKDST